MRRNATQSITPNARRIAFIDRKVVAVRVIRSLANRLRHRQRLMWDISAVAGARLVRQLVLVVAMAIAARMLGKELIGVWSLIYIVIQFGVLLGDSGISTFVVQNRQLTPNRYATAFYLSGLLALFVTTIVLLIGIPIANAFGFTEHRWKFVAAAGTIVPMTLSGLLMAKLRREKLFAKMFVADICGSMVLFAGILMMLSMGLGLWSFVVPFIVSAVFSFLVCAAFCGLPRPALQRQEIRVIADYSLGLVGFSSVHYWARNVDHLLIGRFLGAAPLGVYSFAYRIMMLPLSQINATAHTIALPYLAPLQDDDLALQHALRRITAIVGMLTTLPMIWIWLERDLLIHLVLGEKWMQVSDLLVILAPLAVLQALINVTGLCFQVRGETNLLFRLGMIRTSVTIASFVIGVWLGSLQSVVVAYAIANVIMVPLSVGWAMQTIDANLFDWLNWSFPFFLLLLICFALSSLVPMPSDSLQHAVMTIVSTSVLGGLVYAWVIRRIPSDQPQPIASMNR